MTIKTTQVEIRMGELGLTRKELAERCNIKPQNLSTILKRGTAGPSTVVRIARVLDLSPDVIIKEV